jgi:cytochrome c
MRTLLSSVSLTVALLFAPAVYAAGQATADDAKAMAVKAAEYLKAVGPDKAFPDFDAKDGSWHDRDLYVYVLDNNGVMLAHGSNPGLIGKTVLDVKDVDGKPMTRETLAVKDSGWVNFKWQNPLTKAVEPKVVYVVRVGDYFVEVGAYSR